MSDMLKALYNTENTEKNTELVNLIESGLSNLNNDIGKMSKNEIELNSQNK